MTQEVIDFTDFEEAYKDVSHEFVDAKILVRQCLEDDTRCRNDDRILMLKVWEKQGLFIMIDVARWKQMHSPETIRRVRQDIQSTDKGKEGEFLPTDPNVLIKRKVREEAIRKFYGSGHKVWNMYQVRKYDIK